MAIKKIAIESRHQPIFFRIMQHEYADVFFIDGNTCDLIYVLIVSGFVHDFTVRT